MFQFDIPETQLIAVMILGFMLGAIALPYFIKRPVAFLLIGGAAFFAVRYFVALWNNVPSGTVVGNGIITAGIMWLCYIGMMFIGDFLIRRRYDENYSKIE